MYVGRDHARVGRRLGMGNQCTGMGIQLAGVGWKQEHRFSNGMRACNALFL